MATSTKLASSSERSRGSSTEVAALPVRDAVALRAYELFQERGCEPGRDIDDWLRAEHEIEETRRQHLFG
jgi:hypothetical protein